MSWERCWNRLNIQPFIPIYKVEELSYVYGKERQVWTDDDWQCLSYGSYYQNYRSEIKQVSVDEVKQQDKQQLQAAQEDISTLQQEYRQQEDTRSRSADLENISLTFCKNDTYDYIGKDASLENLDMMSAISDMQKDKVLEQYQYFVKPKDVLLSDVDGTVIQK